MKRFFILTAVVMALFCNIAQAREYDTVTLKPGTFSAITCNVPCDMKYAKGAPQVVITAEKSLIEVIKVEVLDDELKITLSKQQLRGLRDVKIYVTGPDLYCLNFKSAADFECESPLRTNRDFILQASGAADIEIKSIKAPNIGIQVNGVADCEIENISTGDLNVTLNGAGDIELGGTCKNANLTINGAGDIDIQDLKADKVNSAIRGAGSISRD